MITIICYFFSFFVEAIILWQYASALFVPKHQTKVRLILLCALYLILFIVSLNNFIWLNASLYLLVNFIFLLTMYQLKWHSVLFHSAVLTAVMSMCELTVYNSIIGRFAPHFLQELSIPII